MPTGPGQERVGILFCAACQESDDDLPGDSVSLPPRSRAAASSLRHTSALRGTIAPPNPCVRRCLSRATSSRVGAMEVRRARSGVMRVTSGRSGVAIATRRFPVAMEVSSLEQVKVRERVRSLVRSCSRMFSFMIETRSGSRF